MVFKKRGILVFMLFASLHVVAQDTLKLSLPAAREYALKYNRTLIASGLTLRQTQSQLWESVSKGLPQFSITGSYQNYLGATADFQGMLLKFGQAGSMDAQVNQMVFNAGFWVGLKLAKLNEEMAKTNRRKSEQDVIQQVTSSYYAILVGQKLGTLLQQSKQNLQDVLIKTQAMVQAGAATQTDADQIEVQLASTEDMIKSNERQVELGYNMLRIQMGIPAATVLILKDSLSEYLNDQQSYALLLQKFAVNTNPSFLLSQKQVEIAHQQLRQTQASWLPSISVFYDYTYKYIKPQFDLTPKSYVGLQASWPLFSSGGTLSRIHQAKLQIKINQNNLAALTDQLEVQDQQARFNLRNAMDNLQTQTRSLDVAHRVFNDVVRKHDHGMASSLDVTNASSNLIQVETNYVNAMYNVLVDQLQIEMLLNKF
ncbi:MAG: TolC family protein [Microbacter sp.]